MEKPLKERRGEWTNIEINASWSKITFISRWKSSTKGGRSTSTSGYKRWRTPMVSLDGVAGVLEARACTIQMYSLTCHGQGFVHNVILLMEVGGSGVGSRIDSKHLRKAKVCALIMCSSCNVSQLPPMYWRKPTQVFWWPLSPPHVKKDKHQKRNNKKTCKATISKGSDVNQHKEISLVEISQNVTSPFTTTCNL